MTMVGALTSYLGLCLLITVTPGLDTAVVTRSVLLRGRRSGLLTAAGCAAGLLVHAAAVAFGLATLLAQSAAAFEAVKLTGAAVLIVLGSRALWSSRRRRAADAQQALPEPPDQPTKRLPFVQGLLTNLTNPKATLFFLAVLPQFLPHEPALAFPTALGLGAIAVAFSMTGLSLWAVGISRVRHLFSSTRLRRVQERMLGVTLIALGARVATE
jgi:threonine/homoserine/homoserine lactone efflux protein